MIAHNIRTKASEPNSQIIVTFPKSARSRLDAAQAA